MVIYRSSRKGNNVIIAVAPGNPAAGITIAPISGHYRGAVRDVWSFISDYLPDYGTLAASPHAIAPNQLSSLLEKISYVFRGKALTPPTERGYSLDVARGLHGFYTNPEKAARLGIRVEISPNSIMKETNGLSQNFNNSFQDLRALAPDVDITKFKSWTPEQVKLWNRKYTQLGYPSIDPKTRSMPYYLLRKIPRK